jgi:ribosomal protein S21
LLGFAKTGLANSTSVEYNNSLMIQVTRKDSKESTENLLRRFNRKVQQSGTIAVVKNNQFFQKDISKPERRRKAIIRQERKAIKLKKIKLGLR